MTTDQSRLAVALNGRYRIERELGAGGMATVYLAHDLKHDRKVALKVLKPELAAVLGAERFVQEIKTTAALQHPHILPLFDSGAADGFLYYVMPFIDGETLRAKLDRETQLGIDDAVRITTEIADALNYAHTQGVVHRDIKPENILLANGRPMVADFGIALALSAAAGGRMTETGMSLGTPFYMSPEQATADKEITGRSDIYSLASVLFEMLTGEPPHMGNSAQAIIMKIVTEDAQPVTKLRKSVPPNIAAAVAKALEKVPADRFATAAQFTAALADPNYAPTTTAKATAGPALGARGWRGRRRDPVVLLPTLVAVAALVATAVLVRRPRAPVAPAIRFVMSATDSSQPFPNYPWPAAISPDGDMVIYTVARGTGSQMLYLLRTDQLEAHAIPGTVNAFQPYFSPDGKWLAFEADGKERKVRLDGSAPVTIANGGAANGSDWLVGDQIVMGSFGSFPGLSIVNAGGGTPVALTVPDTAAGDHQHLWPIGLPDGTGVIFTVWRGGLGTSQLAIASLKDGAVSHLGIEGIRPLAVLDGMLVYVQVDGAVMAVALDASGHKVEGRPLPVHDPVSVAAANNGNSGIFVSRGGALVTSQGGSRGKLVWIGLDGRAEPIMPQARGYSLPRLSPDERRISVVLQEGQRSDVWFFDRALGTFTRLTSAETVTSAGWSADGSRIIFTAAGEETRGAVWSQAAAGGSPAEKLFEQPFLTPTASMSPDGRSLLVNSLEPASWDIFRIPLDSEAVKRAYLTTPTVESDPRFSPDGNWVAVVSNESGRDEVYVRSFPDPSSKTQVSVAGGTEPTWSRNGRRLYYRSGSVLMAARVALSPSFTMLGNDTILHDATLATTQFWGADYDVTRDGTHIVAVQSGADDFQLVISPNWITEFRRRIVESRGSD